MKVPIDPDMKIYGTYFHINCSKDINCINPVIKLSIENTGAVDRKMFGFILNDNNIGLNNILPPIPK